MKNRIPKNWQELKLGNLIRIKHGYAFKGEHFSDKGRYILLTPGNFSEKEGIRFNKTKYYTGSIPNNYILRKNDLLVVMTDVLQSAPYLGAPGFISEDDLYLHNQRLGLVTEVDKKKINKEFLYWLFQTNQLRGQIRGSASGSTVKHTAPERIYSCEVVIPENIDLQKKIASILFAFDDKIETNNKIAKTLEKMAQTFFKELFILNKNNPWKEKNIEEVCETYGGGTPSTKERNYWVGGMIHWATPTDMTALKGPFIFETEKRITENGLKKSSAKLLPEGTILMTSRATVGILAISRMPISTNQGFISIVCKESLSNFFMYCWLKQNIQLIQGLATGSTFPEISRGVFRKIKIYVPDEEILDYFNEIVRPMFEKIANIIQENQKLATLRDLLLPKLMKGEIRI